VNYFEVILFLFNLRSTILNTYIEMKKIAYFDNNTQKIMVREVKRTELIKSYIKKNIQKSYLKLKALI
ncbi:MAG: hypothetical protein VX790_01195, partial [Bacteroidota bacterium]|nr:hypothetical protein [Bacteroidota bacterium]